MKRFVFVVMILLLCLSLLPAAVEEKLQRRIVVQGAFGSVTKVVFSAISTQSGSFYTGMPFDIEGRLVQWQKTENGREIAHWSIISNSKFKLNVYVGKLAYVKTGEGDTNSCELDYQIKFTYDFGYYDSSSEHKKMAGYFIINTEDRTSTYTDPNSGTKNGTPLTDDEGYEYYEIDILPTLTGSGLVGSAEGSVYFMFSKTSTERIEADSTADVPSGNYEAKVTIKIVGA